MDSLGLEYYPEYKIYEGPNWDFYGTYLGSNDQHDFVFKGSEGESFVLGQGRVIQVSRIVGTTDEELELFIDGLDRNEDGDPLEEVLELILDKLSDDNLSKGHRHLLQGLEINIRDYEGDNSEDI